MPFFALRCKDENPFGDREGLVDGNKPRPMEPEKSAMWVVAVGFKPGVHRVLDSCPIWRSRVSGGLGDKHLLGVRTLESPAEQVSLFFDLHDSFFFAQ
jgi:hypothetical protein